MLTQEEDVEIHAFKKQGWTISEIARHTGRDRKTIRAYLSGARQPGVRMAVEPDPFDLIEAYVRQRLSDDHGVWATTLFDEVEALGYDRSYPTFTRKIRQRRLRPHCEGCSGVKGRATVIIDHPAGEEIQWDWDELGTCPWDPTVDVSMLVGSLSHSSMSRAWLSYSEDQPHLIEGVDQVLRRFGGTPKVWAGGSDGDGDQPDHGEDPGVVRTGGEALRGDGGAVPTQAGEPQRRCGKADPLFDSTLVANPPGRQPG